MGIWLRNVEDLRRIEWGKLWLWDIQFPTAPAPFNVWFPASEVEENIWSISSKDFTSINTSFGIPEKSSMFTISITFFDDAKSTIEKWLDKWVNEEILGNGAYVQSLEDAVKQVRIAKLNNKHNLVWLHEYWVFPKGEYFFKGTSEAGVPSEKLDLIIAGTISKTNF